MESTPPAYRPAGLPSPRSPTLSEISMILPEGNRARSVSPPHFLFMDRPPSPPNFYSHSNRSEHTIKLDSASERRRGPSPKIRSPPLSTQSSRATLRRLNDSASTSMASHSTPHFRPHTAGDNTLASSPTVDDGFLSPHNPSNDWDSPSLRRLSSASSMCSEDFENMKRWPGFDSHPGFDDSGVDLEDEEGEDHDQFPVGGYGDSDHDHTGRWTEDDHYTSDLYSRRAEIILANAKKRLNVMEGNLRGARQSLVVSPTLGDRRITPDISTQISAARERDRKLYAGIGPIPPRPRPYASSSSLSANMSPIHARGLSETSVPLPFASPNYMTRHLPNKRASSAMGLGNRPWSPENHGNGRFPIRESRSFEVMRDMRGTGVQHEEQGQSLRSHSRGSRSPPNVLETLPEDGSPPLRRSASTTDGLRDQMNDLKGRISSLKLRAQEDHLRRRSIQSLRTPSPFTSAETWYSGADAYKSGTSPIAANAGVGSTLESPSRRLLYEDEGSDSTPREAPATSILDHAEQEEDRDFEEAADEEDQAAFHYDESHLSRLGLANHVANVREKEQEEDETEDDESDFLSAYGTDNDGTASSVYEDAVYEMPATERHEDRIDAFDYEHFFLHSAMGTYSAGRRGSNSSSGSVDSVATTRPVTAILTGDDVLNMKRQSMHQRNSSMDSVSTMDSFATAAEDRSDDEDEESNEAMDQFSELILTNHTRSTTPGHPPPAHLSALYSPRSDSSARLRKAPSSSSLTPKSPSTYSSSRGSSPAASELMTAGLQTSKIYSILTSGTAPRDESQGPRLALNEEEKQLIYSLAASFQQICARLQSTTGDQYERKEARRRLDEARRVIDGEELEGLPF